MSLDAHLVVRREGFALDVDLSIPAGTTAALLGPNGAGKSTTVDALAGIVPIDGGRIVLGSEVLDDPASGVFVPSERRRVGVVFQRLLLFDHLDVLDNVAFGPSVTGLRRGAARAVARRWIELLDLDDLTDRRPSELSGGQAQRVALARALATEPELLLLDEPLASIAVATRTLLRRTLSDHLRDHDGPRLLITHDPTDAFLLADRVHVLEDGRITQSGTAEEIRRRPATAYVAALAGANLLGAHAARGELRLDRHDLVLVTSDATTSGAVLVTIQPRSVALHDEQPSGSPRNTWSTTVAAVEPLGEVTRVTLGDPLPLSADITPSAATALGLVPGSEIWASVKATEVDIAPA